MLCGSCLRDNALAAALTQKGHEVALIPTYTPLRTDEVNVSIERIFYNGINVYLQQKFPLFRNGGAFLEKLFDNPGLIKLVSRFGTSTNARELGELTVSVLQGEEGNQRKELHKLVAWLRDSYRPEIVQITNSMFLGLAREIKKALNVPVLCVMQGEDIFLEDLIEPYKSRARAVIRERAKDVEGFIATSDYYARFMSGYLGVPSSRIHTVRLGINMDGHGILSNNIPERPFTIGYLARICPEKGLHLLVEAFLDLARRVGPEEVRLKVAGYLGKRNETYFENIKRQIKTWKLDHVFEYAGEINREEKIIFLNSLHVLSVPTPYKEPKGLFLLEALANGIPAVQPAHGAFPEILEITGGGVLVDPNSPEALAEGLYELMNDSERRRKLGQQGRESVHRDFTDKKMAEETLAVFRQYL